MNVFKITHSQLHKTGYVTHYTIIPAQTIDEAIQKVKPEIILSIDDLGQQPKDKFKDWWDIWNGKAQNSKKVVQEEIRKIKSPSKKIKK
tara:strand:+ start:916 stop:1182 length:267 start_codon:yes stop_codon:yes gene_type:complete